MELLIKTKTRKSFTDFVSLFFAIALIFAIAIFFIILAYAYDRVEPKLNEGLSSAATPETDSNVTEILGKSATAITRINVLFPLLLIGIFGFVMVVALLGKSHPAFLFVGLIVLAVALIIGAIFSNFYDDLIDNPSFTSISGDFNIMNLILNNLTLIILVLFCIIAIVLYFKSGGQQGY